MATSRPCQRAVLSRCRFSIIKRPISTTLGMHICCIANHFDKEHCCSTVERQRISMPACSSPAFMASQAWLPQAQSPSSHPVPVINLGRLRKDPATRALAIQDIVRACREWGCFQVSACCLFVALYPPQALVRQQWSMNSTIIS